MDHPSTALVHITFSAQLQLILKTVLHTNDRYKPGNTVRLSSPREQTTIPDAT